MSNCIVCAEPLPAEAKTCHVCGTSVSAPSAGSPAPNHTGNTPSPSPGGADGAATIPFAPSLLGQNRICPDCGAKYDGAHGDDYCACGAALVLAAAGLASPAAPNLAPPVVPPPPAAPSSAVVKPPPGTLCLVVYSAQREPVSYFELNSDVTMIGRSDPLRGDFPDVDLAQLLDEATAKRVSRKHALILRQRETQKYVLRPLAKNTGTQLESELTVDLQEYPLFDGARIILGGVARLKFEIVK